jgi:general secretion pathway protein M
MSASFSNLPGGRRGQAMALGVTLIALVILWTGVVAPLIGLYEARQETLAQRRGLLVRMTMLADQLPTLRRQAGEKATAGPAPQALIEGASDAVASATLQERIQQMATQSEANLASVEALPGEQAGALRRIGLRVTLTTSWPVLVNLLAAIDEASPRMLVDDLQLQGSVIQVRQGEARLEARLNIYAFRVGKEPSP